MQACDDASPVPSVLASLDSPAAPCSRIEVCIEEELGMISKCSIALALAVAAVASVSTDSRLGFVNEAAARTVPSDSHRAPGAMPRVLRPGLPFGSDFLENWDSYVVGSNVHGQGGWKGWANDPNAGAFVDDAQSVSPSNSINIEGASDLIHEFSGYTSGVWTVTAQQYIPDDFAGENYFIFENVYSDVDPNVISWSTQVVFRNGNVENFDGAANPGSLPYVTGEWVELKLVIDLDLDVQTFYYGGTELYSGSWTDQFPDQGVPGILNIGSIDLFANGGSTVFYDDVSIVAGTSSGFGVTLEGDSLEGAGPPGSSVSYTLTVTNTGTSTDTFDITAAAGPGGWVVTPSVASVTLDAGLSTTVDVTVDVPGTATIGDSDTSDVTATSQGDPTATATATLTTTAGVEDTIFADGFDGPPT
jgi:alpha-galactosidase-like protein